MDKMREAFEKWALDTKGWNIDRNSDGSYKYHEQAWLAWQANNAVWEEFINSPASRAVLQKVGFTCERTMERHTFTNMTNFIVAFLTVKRERDEAQAALTHKELEDMQEEDRPTTKGVCKFCGRYCGCIKKQPSERSGEVERVARAIYGPERTNVDFAWVEYKQAAERVLAAMGPARGLPSEVRNLIAAARHWVDYDKNEHAGFEQLRWARDDVEAALDALDTQAK